MPVKSGNFGAVFEAMEFDWSGAREEDRKRLYRCCKVIVDLKHVTWDALYAQSFGTPFARSTDFDSNFSRGKIARSKAALIHHWITETYPEIGKAIAPSLFTTNSDTGWEQLIDNESTYGHLHIRPFSARKGIVQSALKHPVSDTVLKLGQPFCFDLTTQSAGHILAFQSIKDDWYSMPLDMQTGQLSVHRPIGQHLLPWDDTENAPHPIAEYSHAGLHRFVFVLGAEDVIQKLEIDLYSGIAIRPNKLQSIAKMLRSQNEGRVFHRLNVVFG
ncbi:hypothetical protein [Pseudaestuariivita rosea]|uniref:hypothetical protein n=1 Tax=Pseudaestuariivita rosea TaxID=2763263 RepID=UPI001ABB21B0|nr:hypothetical protein [Pseudaestuariivita rosea]